MVQKCCASSHGDLCAKLLFYVITVHTCFKVLLSHDNLKVLCLSKQCTCYLTGQCNCRLMWTQRLPLICWLCSLQDVFHRRNCCWLVYRCRLVYFKPASQLATAGEVSVVWEKRHVCSQAKCVEHGCRGPHHALVSDSGNCNSKKACL